MPKAISASSSKSLRFRLVHHGTTLKRWTVNDGHIVMPAEDTQNQDLNPVDDQEQLGQVFSSLDLGRSPSPEAHPGGRKSSKKLRKKSVRFHPHARLDERSDSDRDATSPPPTTGARPTSPSSWSISRTTRAIVGGVKKHIKGRLRSLSPPPADSSLIPTRPNTPSPQPSSSTTSPVCHRPAWENGRLYEDPSQLDDFKDTELFTQDWAPSCAPATVPEVADELPPYEEVQEPAPVLAYSDAPFMGTVSFPEVTDDAEDEFATEAYIPSDAVDEDARPGVDWDEYNLPTEVTNCEQAANVEYEGDCDSNDDGNDSEDEDEAAQNVPTEPTTPVLQLQALQLCEEQPVNRPVSEEEVVDILHEAVDEAIMNELAQQDFGDLDVRSHRRSSAPSLDLPKPEDFLDVPGLTITPPTPPFEAAPRTPPAHSSDLAPTPVHTRSCSEVRLVFDEIGRSPPPTSEVSAFTSRVESTPIEKLAPPPSLPLFPQTAAKTWPEKDALPVPKNMVFNYTSHKVAPMFADHLPRFAPAPPTTVYHFEVDVVMDVDGLEEDMEMDDAASLYPSHSQYAIPPYLPPQYHLSQYPHSLYPPPQYRYPRYPLSPPPRYASRRRTTTTRSGQILNFGRPSPPRQLPRPSCLRRSSSPPSAAHRRVRTPRRLQNRNSVKRSYRRRNLAATRQKRLRSLQMRAQRATAATSSDEDDAMDGASSVAHEWAPTYYPRRSYADLPDEDEEMSDESARSPLVGADHSTRDASPKVWPSELTVRVPEVPTLPLPVTEATPRTIVEHVPQIAAPLEVVDIHQAGDANIVGSSTGAVDLAATPAVANAASAAASTAASTASTTSEPVFGTPTPAPPVELAPATPEVTEPACPEPIPRPVIASSVPALDYLSSTQTWRGSRPIDDDDDDDDAAQWEVVVAPLPRAPATSISAPAPATFPATASRQSEGFQQASIQEAQDTVPAPESPTTATNNTSPASVAAQQEAETAAALLSLADAARAKSANGGGSSRRREANLARELARKKIIEAAKALQEQQANESPEDHAPASADEQPSSNPNPDASASHTHHRTEAGVDEQSEEHAPPTPRVDKGKGKDTSSANQPPEEVATTAIDPAVAEELAKSLLTEEEREFNMNPRVWSTFNNRRSRPAPLDLSKPGPSRLPGYSLWNDVPAVQVGSFVKSATIPTARDKNHEASNDIVLVGVSSLPASDAPSAENAMDVTSPSRPLDREGNLNVLTVSEKWQTPTPPPAKSASGPDSIPTIEITPPSPDATSSEPEPSLATPDDIFDAIDAPDTPAKMVEDDGGDDDDDFPEPLWHRTPPKPALPKADRPTRQLPRRLGKQHATPVTATIHTAAAVPVAVSSYSSLAGALGDLSGAPPIPSAPNSSSPAAAKISVTAGNAQRSNAPPSPDVIHCLDSNAGVAKLASPVSPRQEVVAHVTVDAPKLVKDSSVAPSPSPASSTSAGDAHTQEALLLLAFAQTPRIDTSRTSLSAPAAPLPVTPDIMHGVEASLAEDFAVKFDDDDAMNADLSLFDDLPYEECCTPAPSPAYYPYEAAYSPYEAADSPYEAAYSPYEAAYSPYEAAYSPFEAARSPYEVAYSPYEAADSPYYGDLSHVASPAAIDDMHTDDVSAMADQALQILADLKAQQAVDISSSHEVTMFEPMPAGEGQPIATVVQGEDIDAVSDHRMDDASAIVTDARNTPHTPPVRNPELTKAELSVVSDSAGAAEPLDIVTERVDPAARGPETPQVSLSLSCADASNPVPDSPTSLPEGDVEQILAVPPKRTNTGLQPVQIAHPKRDTQAFNATKDADSSVVSQGSASVSAVLSSIAASAQSAEGKVQDLAPHDDLREGESSDTSASASAEEIDAVSQPETSAEPSNPQPTLVSSYSDSVQQAISTKVEAAPEQRRDTPVLLAQSEKKADSPETTSHIEQSDVCPGVLSAGVETSASSSAPPDRLDVTSRPPSSRATRKRDRVARALSSFLGMPCTTPFSVLQFALDGGYSDLRPKHHGPEHRRHVPYQRTEWSERRLKAKSSWQKRMDMLSDIPEVVLEDVVSSLKSEGLEREFPFASGVDSAVEAARKQANLERSRLRELPCFESKAVQTDPLPHEKPLPVGEDRSVPARAPPTRTRRDATVQVPPVEEDKPKASESRDTRPLPSRPSGASSRPQPASEPKKSSGKVDDDKSADAPRAPKEKQGGSQSKPSARQHKAKSPRPRPATSAKASENKEHSESLPRFDRPRPSQPPPKSRRPYCSGRYSANFDLDDESDSESPEVSAPSPTPAPQPSGSDNSRAVVLANSRLNTEPQQAGTGDEEAMALAALWARWWPICLLWLLVYLIDRGL